MGDADAVLATCGKAGAVKDSKSRSTKGAMHASPRAMPGVYQMT